MGIGIKYATREDVKTALDSKATARDNAQVDRALDAATIAIHGLCHRTFYPEIDTRRFDWPDRVQHVPSWRLWLDANEIISVTTFVSGGVTIPAADLMLYPNSGPPYNRVEISLASSSALSSDDTHQQAISITGLYGHTNVEAAAGQLAEALDASETAVDVTDSAAIGVGSIIRVDSERMVVIEKTMLTTGQTLQTPLTDKTNGTLVAVTNGAAFTLGETILLDAERMLVEDIAGNNLVVKRAWDGSTLAAHTGSTIYAPRTLIVERGALGTTAASHTTSTAIARWVPPPLVWAYAVAHAINTVNQQRAGYARTVGSAESEREASGRGLRALEVDLYTACGRKARSRAV